MTTSTLKTIVRSVTGISCNVRQIKKGSLKGNFQIVPVKGNLFDVVDELKGIGFTFVSSDAAFLPYLEGAAI